MYLVNLKIGDCERDLEVDSAFFHCDSPIFKDSKIIAALIDCEIHKHCRKHFGRKAKVLVESVSFREQVDKNYGQAPPEICAALETQIHSKSPKEETATLCGFPVAYDASIPPKRDYIFLPAISWWDVEKVVTEE